MTKPINTASIEKATDKPWKQWVKELDQRGARDMTHTELARKLYDELDGQLDNHGWWAQGITVAYEQHIGKRVPGQLANGLFELTVSKSSPKSREELFGRVIEYFESTDELNGHELLNKRSSQTPRRSNWRCDFADGSKFAATVEGGDARSKLVLSHTALPSKQVADQWKSYWSAIAQGFSET